MLGISIKKEIGIGDALQYCSVPENYYMATGEKLLDVSRPWFFDHNPYVFRCDGEKPSKVIEMWNFSPIKYPWPNPRAEGMPRVYLSNAELHAAVFGVQPVLTRPRLYKFEEFPFEKREKILLHIDGRSHGEMPEHVLQHILTKYKPTGHLVQIGLSTRDLGIPRIETPTLWDLAKTISSARMFIGMDSGPSWIAACYPDVVLKKIRVKPSIQHFRNWVPLSIDNYHSHWDDRMHHLFNVTEFDVGITYSYKKL